MIYAREHKYLSSKHSAMQSADKWLNVVGEKDAFYYDLNFSLKCLLIIRI